MKELRLRAWHKYNKKMYKVRKIQLELDQYTQDGYVWLDREVNPSDDGQIDLSLIVLMEYVGFNDKNNKPIYEGDIDDGGYVVTYLANLNDGLGMEAGWYLQRDDFESWSKLECTEDIEIIGNIFETPQKAINNCNTDYAKIYFKED